ncbi:MAG: excinuclease ABC subunit B, partial [Bartonella sp.]|nr:excinuclease ABC subunit B [Bartonella sp.]
MTVTKKKRSDKTLATGFSEAPQMPLDGIPLTGTIADWAESISKEAEKAAKKPQKLKSQASKPQQSKSKSQTAKSQQPALQAKKSGRTSRGTSIGAAATAKQRAAAGLNPVAGLDVGLEDAPSILPSGATATVEALSALIASGNPLFK